MMIRWLRFNFNLGLALLLVLGLGAGCSSVEGQRKKLVSTLRVFIEVPTGTPNAGETVPVYRDNPVMIHVEKEPCLTESNIKSAKVIDIIGGFALSIQFNHDGTLLLEQYTTSNRGRRFPVVGQWVTPPGKTLGLPRWLAAPQVNRTLSDGQLVFTPDATRDEAELLAQGLNNVARKTGSDDKW